MGSREDSLQELLLLSRSRHARVRDQALFQVTSMAALDSAETVRRAARLALIPTRAGVSISVVSGGDAGVPHNVDDWIQIPRGAYQIGTDKADAESLPEERPLHTITIDDFYILRTPVAVWQFQLFAD